jgi:trans-aconitate 2-methyltransferase
MTEWDASEYARISGLQEAMAEEVLLLLDLKGARRVLDVGCGNGKVTAEIASRVPQGSVLGVDSSADMIAFASSRFGPPLRPNLRFEIADARRLTFRDQFDLVVSFNALHWIHEQDQALRSIRSAMKFDGAAQLRLVPKGKRKSLENVIEETRLSPSWFRYFQGFNDSLSPPDAKAISSIGRAERPARLQHSHGRQSLGFQVSLCIPGF